MAGLCQGDNGPLGYLKAIRKEFSLKNLISIWDWYPLSFVMNFESYAKYRNPVSRTSYDGWEIIVVNTRYLCTSWMIVHVC
ncbi:hypothetical protein ANN_23203 [Periplaneta americana]|uniref:Uncharacterized protein n=1 Tax=Periplaneta americana TaxID=6978 RepID=A0ABQ8SMH6_PERAM|nr:hypothetical protein ANN_23203 [Periplaneta americana]